MDSLQLFIEKMFLIFATNLSRSHLCAHTGTQVQVHTVLFSDIPNYVIRSSHVWLMHNVLNNGCSYCSNVLCRCITNFKVLVTPDHSFSCIIHAPQRMNSFIDMLLYLSYDIIIRSNLPLYKGYGCIATKCAADVHLSLIPFDSIQCGDSVTNISYGSIVYLLNILFRIIIVKFNVSKKLVGLNELWILTFVQSKPLSNSRTTSSSVV